MSAIPPQQLDGSQSPSQIEFLWERYRKGVNLVLTLLLCVIAGFYVVKYMRQRETNKIWSEFSVTAGLDKVYTSTENMPVSLSDSLERLDLAQLEKAAASTDPVQAPYFLLALARKAIMAANWDRAESALKELETRFPQHELVASSAYPIQVREQVKKDDAEENTPRNKKPELKPEKAGSVVAMLREQIASGRQFKLPSQFAKQDPPADSPRVKFEFSDGSSFTIALFKEKAPKHCEEFLKLVQQEGGPFWKGLSVDEIQRNGTTFAKRPKQLHLGFETTRETDRSKWTKTDPSKHIVEFEQNNLSHFAGAVAAREEKDGKSCADRFWVAAEDAAEHDGERVIFGYVVEGLDSVKKICEAGMSAQEDESGVGVPSDKITVTNVTLLPAK